MIDNYIIWEGVRKSRIEEYNRSPINCHALSRLNHWHNPDDSKPASTFMQVTHARWQMRWLHQLNQPVGYLCSIWCMGSSDRSLTSSQSNIQGWQTDPYRHINCSFAWLWIERGFLYFFRGRIMRCCSSHDCRSTFVNHWRYNEWFVSYLHARWSASS